MTTCIHPSGDYSFVPGIAPYSCGVVSNPGFEIVSVTLNPLPSWQEGFRRIEAYLSAVGRPKAALCAMSLRSPAPFSFDGFAQFNRDYAAVLRDWGVFVDDMNPVARTNVAPLLVPPREPALFGFAYTRPCDTKQPPTFVVAGAGELPEGVLCRDGIIRPGDVTPDGLAEKTRFVMDLMDDRLQKLGVDWSQVSKTNVYTIHPIHDVVAGIVNPRIGAAGISGVTWHYARPPIEEIEYEMDTRGVRTELSL